jgi:hypothetical protein
VKCAQAGIELAKKERARRPTLPTKTHARKRNAGKLVHGEERIEVHNADTGAVMVTVAAAGSAQVAQAFRFGGSYSSKLTRCDRRGILTGTAEIVDWRREAIACLMRASGLFTGELDHVREMDEAGGDRPIARGACTSGAGAEDQAHHLYCT